MFDCGVSKLEVLLTSCKKISILCLGINCDYSILLKREGHVFESDSVRYDLRSAGGVAGGFGSEHCFLMVARYFRNSSTIRNQFLKSNVDVGTYTKFRAFIK